MKANLASIYVIWHIILQNAVERRLCHLGYQEFSVHLTGNNDSEF